MLSTIGAGLAAAGLAYYTYATFSVGSRAFFPVICRGPAGPGAKVALTFDDGPTPHGTEPILRELERLRIPAAFFVIGSNAARWPGLLRRIDKAGHLIGNHSFDHARLGVLGSPSYWRDQLARTDNVVQDQVGKRPALFRPPMGFKTWRMARPLREGGFSVVAWSRRGLDGVATTPQRIVQRLAMRVQRGDICVLHDGEEPGRTRDPATTLASLEPLAHEVRARGLEFGRLDEVIGVDAYRS